MARHDCMIATEDRDGTLLAIHCQQGGQPTANGAILDACYRNPNTIRQLINLGDMINLGVRPEPENESDDDMPFGLNCITTQPHTPPTRHLTLDALWTAWRQSHATALYLWSRNSGWLTTTATGGLIPVRSILHAAA